MSTERPKNGEIVFASVDEDVVLYLIVSDDGVVVESCQPVLRDFIDVDVFVHALLVLFQSAENADGEREAHIAVDGSLLREVPRSHLVEAIDQTVISCHFDVGLIDDGAEGQDGAVVVFVEIGGLIAGIGEVEYIVGLL